MASPYRFNFQIFFCHSLGVFLLGRLGTVQWDLNTQNSTVFGAKNGGSRKRNRNCHKTSLFWDSFCGSTEHQREMNDVYYMKIPTVEAHNWWKFLPMSFWKNVKKELNFFMTLFVSMKLQKLVPFSISERFYPAIFLMMDILCIEAQKRLWKGIWFNIEM